MYLPYFLVSPLLLPFLTQHFAFLLFYQPLSTPSSFPPSFLYLLLSPSPSTYSSILSSLLSPSFTFSLPPLPLLNSSILLPHPLFLPPSFLTSPSRLTPFTPSRTPLSHSLPMTIPKARTNTRNTLVEGPALDPETVTSLLTMRTPSITWTIPLTHSTSGRITLARMPFHST